LRLYIIIFLLSFDCLCLAQPTAGTTGLLNIPSADMQPDGTLMFGGNYLPKPMNPKQFSYNTGNYYLNITFLPFLEVNYRCTLLKVDAAGTFNQDRSIALRGRILRERKYIPALVIGGNDIYTSVKGNGNQYFGALYAVATKSFACWKSRINTTMGYGIEAFRNNQFSGLFGGVSFSPGFFNPLTFMAEYDTKAINAGVSLLVFNHLCIYAFAYDLHYFSGGVSYKVYLAH
jgi:hypothetical protein